MPAPVKRASHERPTVVDEGASSVPTPLLRLGYAEPALPICGEEKRSYFVTLVSMACRRSESSSHPAGHSCCREASCSLALSMSPVST